MAKFNVGDIISRAAIFGAVGWAAENAFSGTERYSSVFGGVKVPFLPIYAAGGLAMSAVSGTRIADWPTLARGLVYAVIGTGVEYAGCQIDRKLLSTRSWDYGQRDSLASASDGCVNFARSALWGGLGLVAEKFE